MRKNLQLKNMLVVSLDYPRRVMDLVTVILIMILISLLHTILGIMKGVIRIIHPKKWRVRLKLFFQENKRRMLVGGSKFLQNLVLYIVYVYNIFIVMYLHLKEENTAVSVTVGIFLQEVSLKNLLILRCRL